ncbi:18706_t:CDS:2 [Funneliformis geosporum]|uniref:18706_t:CDS:1 n=1 Tax=Funneliformis geosporum TaxID=1117311 RepID=A0A9W4SW66_9GLOM|nr:18706_t:CDS:2 [Funneliformis geosporum]
MDTGENEEDELFATNGIHQITIKNNNQKSTAIYCQTHIKNKEILLIVDSSYLGCIIFAALMEELGMECNAVLNTIMTSFVVVVEKKNDKKCLCINYQKLNNITKRNHYPLPHIDNMLEILQGSQWFTSLDLASRF